MQTSYQKDNAFSRKTKAPNLLLNKRYEMIKAMNLELIFKILSVVFIGVAAYFLWQGSKDGTFVSAVIGAVCFFLSVRFQIRERMNRRDAETQRELEKEGAD